MPEFHGRPFSATPIYGYWDGHLAFVEAMIARDYLQTHRELALSLAQPSRFETPGRYPTTWSIRYDAKRARYDITFGGLKRRDSGVVGAK